MFGCGQGREVGKVLNREVREKFYSLGKRIGVRKNNRTVGKVL
jgi:hypothetical protein